LRNIDKARISYLPDEQELDIQPAETILQASLRAGIPHTHVCGGRARCSTCRVLILEGLEHCTPRNAREQALATRLSFDPAIRLACQTTITGEVTLRRLVLDDEDVAVTSQLSGGAIPGIVGQEQRLAILFADIRSFTPFAEAMLPYDVIHVLNRYFHRVGQAIRRHGGTIDTYMGDGLMALFGGQDADNAALRAVRAGLDILAAVEQFNPYLSALYKRELRIGIGVHEGDVVVGAVGDGDNRKVTAIGDAVNVASRIEAANKAAGTSFLISEATYAQVQAQIQVDRIIRATLAGKRGLHTLYEVTGVREPDR
jgi:adenylate cyclase